MQGGERMKDNYLEKLELLRKDIDRYIATLIILSSYFYIGAIINTFLKPSNDSIPLFMLTILTIVSTVVCLYKQHHVIKKIEKASIDE